MTTLKEVEALTATYADSYQALASDVETLEAAIRTLKKKMLPAIKRSAERAAEAKEKLKNTIEENRALFDRPRTRVFHGIKVGLQKGKGKIEIANPDKTVELIRRHLKDQADLLIKTEEVPIKDALQNLAASDLKRIGVTVIDATDQTVIKSMDSDVEKIVDVLLKSDDEADAAKRAAA
jgi:hypothetical protein